MPPRHTNFVTINGRHRRPISFEQALQHVRELSESATLRRSPFKLNYIAPGQTAATDPDANNTDPNTDQ